MSAEVIGFIPARGGSQRIPRKNLMPVGGVPLVVRMIRCLRGAGCSRVVVSTDDTEIATVAMLHGADVDIRPPALAAHDATIADVVEEWLQRAALSLSPILVVAEPTCALLRPTTVADAIEHVEAMLTGSVVAVHPNRQLLHNAHGLLMVPRVNSTHAEHDGFYYETGLFVMNELDGHFLPEPCEMMVVDDVDAIDIDEYSDLVRARAGGPAAFIEIRYVQGTAIGSGHMRRAQALTRELEGRYLVNCVEDSEQPPEVPPDLLVLDCLAVDPERIKSERARGVGHIITFDNEASGGLVDANICELHSPFVGYDNQYVGPRFAILRPEFMGHQPRPMKNAQYDEPYNLVVSFGGTDPTGMTARVLNALMASNLPYDLNVVAVAPPLADFNYTIPESGLYRNRLGKRKITLDVKRDPVMAELFLNADLAITSNGLTVHEAGACFCPVIAVAVNAVEASHGNCPGVLYMGTEWERMVASFDVLAEVVGDVLGDADRRYDMANKAYAQCDGRGAERVAFLIDGILGGLFR